MYLLSETVVCQAVWDQVLLTSRDSLQRCVMKQIAAGIKVKIPEEFTTEEPRFQAHCTALLPEKFSGIQCTHTEPRLTQ